MKRKWAIALGVLVCAGLAMVATADRYQNLTKTTVLTAADTNRVSGEILLKVGITDGARQQSDINGAIGIMYASNITNDSDAAFGNNDTVILNYWTSLGGYKYYFDYDTLADVPGTSYVYNEIDSLWDFMDVFGVDVYCADTTEDYSQPTQYMTCTLKFIGRTIEE